MFAWAAVKELKLGFKGVGFRVLAVAIITKTVYSQPSCGSGANI